MRYVARGLAALVFGGSLGGCDVLWASYAGGATRLCDATDPTLVLCLTFDGQLSDGSSNHIAVTGGPVTDYVTGPIGKAAHFTLTTPTVHLGDSTAWTVNEFSFETWVRPDELPTGKLKRFGIMDRQGAYSVFLYKNEGSSDLALKCGSTGGAEIQGLHIPLGIFSHVACTFKAGEQVLYLNGQQIQRETRPGKIAFPGPLEQYLGSNVTSNDTPEPDALVGALDELRFFSTFRTATEIRAAYERGMYSQQSAGQ